MKFHEVVDYWHWGWWLHAAFWCIAFPPIGLFLMGFHVVRAADQVSRAEAERDVDYPKQKYGRWMDEEDENA